MFMFFVPIFMILISMIYIQGVMMNVYVPLVPFIVFSFTALGWFAAVVEAMVAAPIVALGMTHPEGHDLLGKAQQAAMLLLSIFLRPVLLVIGLIAAMILAEVTLRLINSGFSVIIGGTTDISKEFVGGGVRHVFTSLALMIVYTMLMIYVVNTVFNIIPLLAEKVMRWLGLHPDHAGYGQDLQAIKGGVQEGGQTVGRGLSDVMSDQSASSQGKKDKKSAGVSPDSGGGGS